MRLLEINLATRPFRNNTLYWVGFGSAAFILLVLTGMNGWLFFHSGTSVKHYEEEMVLKQQKRDGLSRDEQRLGVKLTKLDFNGLRQQAEFANDAIRRRVFSWTELFNRLEEVVPPAVMLTAVRPEIQAEGISIVAEGMAKDQEGLLDFEEGLIRSAYFARIYPGSERREQRGGELHFSLKFDYLPGGRPDAAPAAPAKKPVKPASEVAGDSTKGSEPPHETVKAPAAPPPQPAPSNIPAGGSGLLAAQTPALPAATGVAPAPAATAPANPQPVPAPVANDSHATAPSKAPPKASSGYQGGRTPPAPGTNPRFTLNAKRGGPAGRSMLKPKMGVATRIAGAEAGPGPEEQKMLAEAAAAASFNDKPLEDVIAYLMKNRSMTFVFDGSFDLRQRVTMDVWEKEQREIVDMLAAKLGAVANQDGENNYRFSKPPETLEEPPVEEEPVPEEPAEEPPPKDDGQKEDGNV
ncbi:MAG: PilN domain-containing protein [Acidobacteria bacterium]|nr:PilN domain-containing protein [Acidobacteriota bacterium]